MEGEQIYPSQSSRIETSLCSRSIHCDSGYATNAFITLLGHTAETALTSVKISSVIYRYCAGTEQVLVFDRYVDLSAKDHERMRHAGEGSTDYNLTATVHYPIGTPFSGTSTTCGNSHRCCPYSTSALM